MAPLSGLRVLELGSGIAAAFCTRLLAVCGADILLVEPLDGHPLRRIDSVTAANGSPVGRHAVYLHAGKRSLRLDLASLAGKRKLDALLTDADVLVHDLDPAAFEAILGGETDLPTRLPRLIVTSITPFGHDGPYSTYAGGELLEYALGGLLYISGPCGRPPVVHGGQQSGYRGGIYAAAATLTAVADRWRFGRGQQVGVALSECIASEIGNVVDEYTSAGLIRRREPADGPGMPEQGVMPCRDGFITAVVGGHYDWASFGPFMEVSELEDGRFATAADRIARAPELNALMRPRLLERTAEEWFERAQLWRFIWGPVREMSQILACPHLQARGFLTDLEHPELGALRLPGLPFRLSASPLPAPLGERRVSVADANWLPRATDPGERGWPGDHGGDSRPLAGLRVIDLGNWVTVPYLCRLLADMGAEVIKVESPRHLTVGRVSSGIGQNYVDMHRGKRSVTLELDRCEGRDLFKRLIATADVLTENFAPRVLGNLRLDYSTLREVNPRLVHCSSTAFGQSGPYRDYGAFGSTLESMMGLAAITGFADDPPTRCGTTYTDYPAAIMAYVAIMAALADRRRTGEGQYIDLSQYEAALSMMGGEYVAFGISGGQTRRRGNRSPDRAPQGVYRCAGEDDWLAISVATEIQFAALCDVISRPDLVRDPNNRDLAGRLRNHDALDVAITAWTRAQEHHGAMRRLQQRGVPAAAVLNPKELVLDEQLLARRFFRPDAVPGVPPVAGGIPWRLSRTPGGVAAWVPAIGADNEPILRDGLGLSQAEYDEAVASGTITQSERIDLPAAEPTMHAIRPKTLKALGRIAGWDQDFAEIVAAAYE